MGNMVCEQVINEKEEKLWAASKKIWENPEVGYKEKIAVATQVELLESEGFTVEVGAYGIPTCIRAVWGQGKPVIGFLGEFDALPGLSQEVSGQFAPIIPGAPGHGCGHSLLGVACIGGAIGFKAELEAAGKEGTVIYYGCPAEELLTGKSLMAARGAFVECDAALSWHPGNAAGTTIGTMTGLDGVKFHFEGKTSHAAASPQDGRSALDAVQIMNIGVEFLREHVTDDVRMHYIITDGGMAPNIVPGTSSVSYFIRALTIEGIRDAYARVVKCAEGAAHMTDTKLVVEHTGGCWPTMPNKVLTNMIHDNLEKVGMPEFTEEEKAFAAEINKNNPKFQGTEPINTFIAPVVNRDGFGSTDVADVEHVIPCTMFTTPTSAAGAIGHHWTNTACSGSSIGRKGMIYGAKVMAATAMDLVNDPAKLQAAKDEFAEASKGQPYVSFMGDDVKPPYEA